MNTSKQINVMVILIFLLLIALGAYTLFDPTRQQDARATQEDLLAQRGATLFAANCRPCHGDIGQGRIGPALNRPDLRDPAKRTQLQAFVADTIMCGRVGTLMPTWGISHGGPLDDEQIRQLVTLITVDPNDAWNNYVRPQSEAANQLATPAPVADLLKGSITGAQDSVCGQKVSTGSAGPPPATPGAPSTSLNETTTDNKFATTDFTVPGGQAVAMTVSNQGNAVHNWHITDAKDASGKDVIVGGDNGILGGQNANLTFTITQAGTYHFQCDFHPQDMLGTLFVLGPGGATPSSAAAAVASATPAAGASAGQSSAPAPGTTSSVAVAGTATATAGTQVAGGATATPTSAP